MPAPVPRKRSAGTLAYWLVLLILIAAFGAYMLPARPGNAVTLSQGPTAAPAQLPDTPTPQPSPTATPVRPTETPAPATSTVRATTGQPASPSDLPAITYVLNTNTRRFHRPDCTSVSEMKPKNRQDSTGTREELITQGYKPCGRCNP